MPKTIRGYFDLAGGPAGVSFEDSNYLVRVKDVDFAVERWKSTLRELIAFLDGGTDLPDLPDLPLSFLNLTRSLALNWVLFFVNHDEAEVATSGLQLRPQQPHGRSSAKDGILWRDSILERVWDKRLLRTKKRQRGIFIKGVRRPKRGAQVMRLRVPHA